MSNDPNASDDRLKNPSADDSVTGLETGQPSTERRWAQPEFFFRTDVPAWKYVIRMTIVSLVPTFLLSVVLAAAGILTEENTPVFEGPPAVLLIGIVVVSPVVETLLMAGFIWFLRFFIRRPVRLAIASCAIWALLHSLMAPLWGLVIAWPFFVFSCAYLAWRDVSWGKAILVAAGIHALHNTLPALFTAAGA